MRHRIAGRGAKGWMIGAALMVATAAPSSAQGTGNGYLFGEPSGRVTLRAGYDFASAGGDFFNETTQRFTLNKSDFSGPTFGGEAAFILSPRYDLSISVDYAGISNRQSAYRHFFEFPLQGDSLPIRQTTTFQRVPVMASVRAYLTSRGRSVGTLAWIPSRVVPWVGAGVGATWYKFRQQGDFVAETVPSCVDKNDPNYQLCPIYTSDLSSSGWGPALQGMGGIDLNLTPRIAATGNARYTWSRASMSNSYEGNKIDLSGVAVTLGLTFRL